MMDAANPRLLTVIDCLVIFLAAHDGSSIAMTRSTQLGFSLVW